MTAAQRRPHDVAGVRDIEEELSVLRAALEDALARADPAGIAAARESLVVALVSFGSPEFDLEARFHVSRLEMGLEMSQPGAIAALLIGGNVPTALDNLASAVDASAADDSRLLKLAFSAILRVGASCPELPWLTALVGRIPIPAERGAAAAQLIRFLPPDGHTRADVACTAAECVASLWLESPEWARGLLDITCRSLIDANDQPLLATTANALLRSLPAGNPAEKNTLGYLLITSLLNAGDIAASTTAMRSLLDDLRAEEAWDRGNFDLLTSIASVAAGAATTALASGDTGVAAEAVAVADRAFGLVERITAPDTETEAEHIDAEHRLSVAFSQVAAVARSLTREVSLQITTPQPPPFFRFRPGETGAVATANSPARSARISEARFLEECARAGWKAIPTPLEVDFGLDYRIEIPDSPGRISTDVEFLVQLKSTSVAPNASGLLAVSINETTLKYWNSKVLPTLVVLFHHPTDKFYTSWYLPALDDATQRTFRFAREDEWDPTTLRTDVQRYYQHMRVALASGGDWSLLAVMQFHCALLIKLLLQHPDVRRAALDPDADLGGAKMEPSFLTLLLMHHRALSAPAPILSDQPNAADIVKLVRTLDAIVRSWTLAGPQMSNDVRFAFVATHRVFKSARDLLHVAVELDCALASAIVEAQETRSAALSRPGRC
jgi:hypothetical protein